jgi:hypothetical protein
MLPERVTVPFSNHDLWNDKETSGRIRAERGGLTLEFEVVQYDPDGWWAEVRDRSGVMEVGIPLGEIEALKLRPGWLETKIELRTQSMKTLEKVPGAKQGRILFAVADKDRSAAKELVDVTKVRLSEDAVAEVERRNAPAPES